MTSIPSFHPTYDCYYQIFLGILVKQQIIYDENLFEVLKGKPSNFLVVNGHLAYRKARSFFTIRR